MSQFVIGNVFLLLAMLLSAGGHVLIKALVTRTPDLALSWAALQQLLAQRDLPLWLVAGAMIGGGFVLWILCLGRLDLSYAYPVACSSVLLVALLSGLFLGETVTPKMWAGTVLIVAGIVLLMPAQ